MLEVYNELKKNYDEYIILIKSGSFYVVFDSDAIVINKIFDYKIVSLKNNIKVGFPINLINKNISKLEDLKINYIIVENNNIINNYNKYSDNLYNYLNITKRINNISNKLISLSSNDKIYSLLENIEVIING